MRLRFAHDLNQGDFDVLPGVERRPPIHCVLRSGAGGDLEPAAAEQLVPDGLLGRVIAVLQDHHVGLRPQPCGRVDGATNDQRHVVGGAVNVADVHETEDREIPVSILIHVSQDLRGRAPSLRPCDLIHVVSFCIPHAHAPRGMVT